jgi:ribosomal-protein-alanine acetyltransferase
MTGSNELRPAALSSSSEEEAIRIEPMRAEDLDAVVALDAMVSNPAWSRAMFESELTTNQFAGFLVARALAVGACAAESSESSRLTDSAARTHAAPSSLQRAPSDAPTPPATLAAPSAAGARVVCGYIGFWIVFEELHLLNVAVHPDWQRRGVAAKLVQAVFETAIARGVTRALLEVRASNLPAQELYDRFGFQVIARRAGYYTQPSEEALIMACEGLHAVNAGQ